LGCQSIKIDANREIVRVGKDKQKFITGITMTLPLFKDKKIIFKGTPYKDPNHSDIIRQEYLTSIKF
jgi:hypothetical protein